MNTSDRQRSALHAVLLAPLWLVACEDTSTAAGGPNATSTSTGSTSTQVASGGTASGTVTAVSTSSTGGANASTSSSGGTTSSSASTGGTASTSTTTSTTTAGSTTCQFAAGHTGTGSITWYTLSQGTSLVNCSYPTYVSSETVEYALNGGQYFAAMNTAEYATAAACGACVQVTRDNGTTVTAMIADQCPVASNPKCVAGHIDLAQPAFLQIGTTSEGYLGNGNTNYSGSSQAAGVISWQYVACPVTGNVRVYLKEPSNIYWNEFMVANHRLPIATFEAQIGGSWTTGTRKDYNYFNVGSTVSFPLTVRITDINGATIVGTLQSGTEIQDLGAQFPTCS